MKKKTDPAGTRPVPAPSRAVPRAGHADLPEREPGASLR